MSLVVSLTTISSRLELCRQTCHSLAHQQLRPDRIVLHVSRDPYLLDSGIEDPMLLDWADAVPGLKVEWVENSGPYRKLLPALKDCQAGDIVVTADDDVLYGSGWLDSLINTARLHPDAIVCGRARRPGRNILGMHRGYWAWPFVDAGTMATGLVPVGIAGVVYRPELLDLDWLNDVRYRDLAPTTDDLWFAEAAQRMGTPILVAPGVESWIHPVAHPSTLFDLNGGGREVWGSFRSRLVRRMKSRLGIPCCANDVNFRMIQTHSLQSGRRD
jgi:hypothetical protein